MFYGNENLARRTFVGNLYKQVKDPNLVGALSGHKEGSRALPVTAQSMTR